MNKIKETKTDLVATTRKGFDASTIVCSNSAGYPALNSAKIASANSDGSVPETITLNADLEARNIKAMFENGKNCGRPTGIRF